MDAFIIRTPRARVKADSKVSKAPQKGQQRRLNDLRGVVVLEDIQKYVLRLKSDEVESGEKVRILQRLAPKQPSTKIISGNVRWQKRPFLSNLCKINIKTQSCLFDLCNPSWHFKIFLHSTRQIPQIISYRFFRYWNRQSCQTVDFVGR